MKNNKYMAAISAVVLAVYAAVVLLLAGFAHGAAFWLSFGLMIAAFVLCVTENLLINKEGIILRDWLFGYSVLRHSLTYVAAELIASTLFLIFADRVAWTVALAVQLVLLAAHLVFAVSCFLGRRVVQDGQTQRQEKTASMRALRAEAELAVLDAGDGPAAAAVKKLAEDIRFSDPVSHADLASCEAELSEDIAALRAALSDGDQEGAAALCVQAEKHLAARNAKARLLK